MKNIFQKILNTPELKDKPPVLVDVGASEQIHSKWKLIAKYSICLAFDADERDFQFIEKEQSRFNKLYVYNCIALDKDVNKADFLLTSSPYCSSVLEPDTIKLKPYLHSQLFEVEKKIELNAIHIQKALDIAKLDYVDWFKSDSQGIDLRLFKSLDERIKKKVLVAEFEPGIIDAYIGEDKLYSVLRELNDSGFWLSDIKIKGVARLPKELLDAEFNWTPTRKLIKESLKKAPGWGEMTFINTFENSNLCRREYLLGWLFSSLERHHSFAFVLASRGQEQFNSDIFSDLKSYSKRQMKNEIYKLKFFPSLIDPIKKKFF
ncbi:MAG: hypothetical protein MUE64_05340 [Ignavibacteriaceae bacterium]|nr:hypothetical protein [Ignavibacteriaceae bacterium]